MMAGELLSLIIVLAVAAAVPGPDVPAVVARALAAGFTRTLPLIVGIVVGHALWMVAAAAGLVAIAQVLGPAFVALKITAAAYLLFLAWRLWHAPAAMTEHQIGSSEATDSAATGVLVSLSNPKALVFFGAVMPSVLPVHTLSMAEIGIVMLVSAATFVYVFGTWAAIAAVACSTVMTTRRQRMLNRTSAVVMAGTGVAVAVR